MYPTSEALHNQLSQSQGWPYKTNREQYLQRDRALIALQYLLALRISELLRLKKADLVPDREHERILIPSIELSKRHLKEKLRKEQYRTDNFLPLIGDRAPFTQTVMDYVETLEDKDESLFPFGRIRAYQIVTASLGIPDHWLRAYGENKLYDVFNQDILAVSDFLKIDVQTLQHYVRSRFKKYPVS
jgi:integrase